MTDVAAVALAAGTTPDDQVGNESVEPPVRSERVVHRPDLGEEFRQLLVQFFDRKSLVGSKECRRALHPDSLPDPYLILGIERVDEEHIRCIRAWAQDGDRVRLVEAGEVPERRVLSKLVLDIVVAGGEVSCREDDRPIVERLRQACPPGREVVLGE